MSKKKTIINNKIVEPTLKTIRAKNNTQQLYLDAIENKNVIFGVGVAGTGKSLLASYMGAKMLYEGAVDKLILTRPAVEADESIGYLPGNIEEKLNPYLRPLYDCLEMCLPRQYIREGLYSGSIEICPIAYLRGRTFNNCFIISDENQNMTYDQLKLLLTRIGEGTKIVLTGDPTQVDLKPKSNSGFVTVAEKVKDLDCVEVINFEHKDIQRSIVTKKILECL